jgi:serine/threonine protein kinase
VFLFLCSVLQPENILLRDDTFLKVADYGSCRGIYTQAPYTEYISTRWYRAPEWSASFSLLMPLHCRAGAVLAATAVWALRLRKGVGRTYFSWLQVAHWVRVFCCLAPLLLFVPCPATAF